MSAAEALKAAHAAGIQVGIDGDDLVLEAPSEPPPAVLAALFVHKVSIVALLKSVTNGGSAKHWRTLFEERTSVFLQDRGLRKGVAEAEALEVCIAAWLNKNPVTSPAGRCIACGRGDRPDDAVLPYGTTPPGAAWMHSDCWLTWSSERRDQALAALAAIGIAIPY